MSHRTIMTFYYLFLIWTVLVIGFYLMVVGAIGVVTGTPLVHQSPFPFNRPILYILFGSMIFFDLLHTSLGAQSAIFLNTIVIAYVVYEIINHNLQPKIELVGATPEGIDADLRDALSKLQLRYQGRFPFYELVDEEARLRVTYWKSLGQGKVTISPSSKRSLLCEIQDEVDRDFNSEEVSTTPRGYVVDLLAGLTLFGVALWQLAKHLQ